MKPPAGLIRRSSRCPYCKNPSHDALGGNENCPRLLKSRTATRLRSVLASGSYFGESPAPFVGTWNYPNINVGILSPPEEKEDVWQYDAPRFWASKDMQEPQIIDYRAALVNARFRAAKLEPQWSSASSAGSSFLEHAQEVAMASRPVELEIGIKDRPRFHVNANIYTAPTGPNALLQRVAVTSNPCISRHADTVFDAADMKAMEAISYLSKHDFDETSLTRMLSVGTLGMKKDRVLVPTKWSITAVDDVLGKKHLAAIRDYNYSDHLAFFGGYLGNYFLVLCFPDVWSYELFETYAHQRKADVQYTTDFEPYAGRRDYAYETAGGYYAARLGILEKLTSMKRQASVLALRLITEEYEVHLGVWVVREAMRKAMNSKPLNFGSSELMLNYARLLGKKKFGINVDFFTKRSMLLNTVLKQKKIRDFA